MPNMPKIIDATLLTRAASVLPSRVSSRPSIPEPELRAASNSEAAGEYSLGAARDMPVARGAATISASDIVIDLYFYSFQIFVFGIRLDASIVVPALNEEEFIEDCLRALRAQTVPAEIIVVDNGSTDGTVGISRTLADMVIVVPGVRIAALRQAGAEAANNDIIVTTDADTVAPPEWLEKLLRHFSDPRVVAAGGPVRALNPGPIQDLYTSGLSVAARTGMLIGSNMAYRRDALLQSGGYTRVKKGEDWELTAKLRRLGRVVFDPEAYVLTDVPLNRQLEFAAIAANAGLLGFGAAIRSPAALGLGSGFFIAEVGSAIDMAPDELHHSQIAVGGLALLSLFWGALEPGTARFLAGFASGILAQHWVTEDVARPTWFHANGALLTGITLLLMAG